MISAWIAPKTLQDTIAPVTALVNEAELHFEKGGIRIETVDSANVGAVSLDLLEDAFHSYESEGVKISIDLERLEEIISKTSDHGNYVIKKTDEKERLLLRTGGYEFKLALVDSDSVRTGPDPRDIPTPASVKLNSDQFSEAIRVALMFSDYLKMGVDRGREVFFMNAEGDLDNMHMTLGQEDVEDMEIAKAYGNYSLNYLEDIRKAIPPNTSVKLGLGEELPLSIQYEIAEGHGRITYGLAPRI